MESFQFQFLFLNKTALFIASEKNNHEIVEILLGCPNINVNEKSILIYILHVISFFVCIIHIVLKF